MEIKKLACELESWAQEKGWKTVTQLITPHHFGDLLQPLDTELQLLEQVQLELGVFYA